jgi:hypothetical protein
MNTELTDLLHAGMERVPAPVPPGLARQSFQRYRKHRARNRAAGAASGIAIVGVATAVAVSGTSATSPPTSEVRYSQAAYLVNHVASALDSAESGMVEYARVSDPIGHNDNWAARDMSRTEAFSSSGQPTLDSSAVFTATTHTIVNVNYQTRTWYRYTRQNPPPSTASPATPSPAASAAPAPSSSVITISPTATCTNPLGLMPSDPVQMADQLREWVGCGKLTLGGTAQVDGVQATALTGAANGIKATYWVDSSTYLPVRITIGYTQPGVTGGEQWDLQWLPATPANLALFNVPIPAGFTQVSPPKLSD